MQNYKKYAIPPAQLIIADVPYNVGKNFYGSNPMWYNGGDNKNGESKLANGSKVGWKNDVQGRERAYALWNWYRLPEWIIDIAERLRMVQIENRPAVEVIERFNYSNVFMYIDPPYVLSTRAGKQYKHEMTDADHEELLKALLQSKAKIMISGYESEMYNDYLNGWKKKQFSSCAEHGKARTETVWMNYEPDPQMKLHFAEVLS